MRSVRWTVALLGVIAVACSRDSASGGGDSRNAEPVIATPTFGAFSVPVGVALPDARAGVGTHWCADFEEHGPSVGDTVTLVWADSSAEPAATAVTQVHAARPGRCAQLPGDTADIDDPDLGSVYELVLMHPMDAAAVAELAGAPAMAVRGAAPWTRNADGFLRADIDGDENPEQARSCTSSEGLHLTLWTLVDGTAAGRPREHRRWRAYQSLGYDVEPSCTERETEDPPEPAATGR
jgi:hypothetical protein